MLETGLLLIESFANLFDWLQQPIMSQSVIDWLDTHIPLESVGRIIDLMLGNSWSGLTGLWCITLGLIPILTIALFAWLVNTLRGLLGLN